MFCLRLSLAAFALATVFSLPVAPQAQPSWTQAGGLTCKVNPNIGFLIVGHQSMECRFTPKGPLPPQAYEGAINTVGIDVGLSAAAFWRGQCSHQPPGCLQARLPVSMSALPAT